MHFGIGIVLCAICVFCAVAGFMVYVSMAETPGSSGVGGVAFFGVLMLVCGFGALWNFGRAFRPVPKASSTLSPKNSETPAAASSVSADEKLAHLVKR